MGHLARKAVGAALSPISPLREFGAYEALWLEPKAAGLNPEWLADAILVPIPPSKLPNDPDYDDRMFQVVRGVRILSGDTPLAKAAELVTQVHSLRKSHESEAGARPSIEELTAAYQINEGAAWGPPTKIVIVDDVLTTGRHFRAMKNILQQRFPEAEIIGVFISRRVFAEGNNQDLF